MKLLMLNWKDAKNPSSGGAEVLTEGILKVLARQGHDITLFTSSFAGARETEIIDGYTVIRRGSIYTVHFWAFIHWWKQLRKENFQLVIDQVHGLPFFTPLYIGKVKKYAFIHETAKEIWFTMYKFPLNWLGYGLEKLYFLFYKQVKFITVSRATKADLMAEGIKEQNIFIIPEAIDQAVSRLANELHALHQTQVSQFLTPTVIFVGRLAPMKRVENLLQAMRMVREKIPTVQLWVVGDGERNYRESLVALATGLKLNVKFYGRISGELKMELMAKAQVLASASLKEGFGLVILEAASVKTPSVVYNVKGFNEAVRQGETGLLTENNPQSLAAGIIKVLSDMRLYHLLASNAYTHSQKFTFENSAKEFEKIVAG